MSLILGFSAKMFFSHAEIQGWTKTLVTLLADQPTLARDAEFFVLPSAPSLDAVATILKGTGIGWGAQYCHPEDAGPHTGDISASVLAELGCQYVEVGHAERRRDHHEGDDLVAATLGAILRNAMTPVLCIGEQREAPADAVSGELVNQLRSLLGGAPPGRVILAYEPAWAIGKSEPAPVSHINAVVAALKAELAQSAGREASSVIYGGSAKPGLLPQLRGVVGGLFLGRFAHDPRSILSILREHHS